MKSGLPAIARGFVTYRSLLAFLLLLVVLGASNAESLWDGGVGAIRKPNITGEGAGACLPCHFGESMQALAAGPHGNHANPATPYSKEGCESCHGPGSFHVSRAHGGTGSPALIRFGRGAGFSSRQEQLDACRACHEDGKSGAPLIGFTGSVHDMKSVNCSRCHTVHVRSGPVSDAAGQASACVDCHRRQKDGHPSPAPATGDFRQLPCSSCHDVHPSTGERAGTSLHPSLGIQATLV